MPVRRPVSPDVRRDNMKQYISILLLGAIITMLYAPSLNASPIVVVEKGIYSGGYDTVGKNSTSPTKTVLLGGNVQLLTATNIIPIRMGSQFGFKFTIPEMKPTEQAYLLWQWNFPPMTNANGEVLKQCRAFAETGLGETNFSMLYTITEPYEVVYGEWTFRLIWQDEVWATETFYTVPYENEGEQGVADYRRQSAPQPER